MPSLLVAMAPYTSVSKDTCPHLCCRIAGSGVCTVMSPFPELESWLEGLRFRSLFEQLSMHWGHLGKNEAWNQKQAEPLKPHAINPGRTKGSNTNLGVSQNDL